MDAQAVEREGARAVRDLALPEARARGGRVGRWPATQRCVIDRATAMRSVVPPVCDRDGDRDMTLVRDRDAHLVEAHVVGAARRAPVEPHLRLPGTIRQDLDLFKMPVELQVQTDGDPEYIRVDVVGEASDFDVVVQRKPKVIVIDPRERLLRMSDDIRIAVLVNRGEDFVADGKYNEAIDEYPFVFGA